MPRISRAFGLGLALGLVFAVLLAPPAQALTVAPTALFLDAAEPTASLLVVNPHAQTLEVSIGFGFAYPASDADGRARLTFGDPDDPASAAPWLRAFPRRFRLAPGARQVVRLRARPPRALEDGEYWARVLVRGLPRPDTAEADGVEAAVTGEVRHALPLFYRRGALSAAVELAGVRGRREPGSGEAALLLDLRPSGEAAFLGRLHVEVRDADGRRLASRSVRVAVYRAITRRVALGGLAPGAYEIEVRLEPGWPTGGEAGRVYAEPLAQRRTVVIGRAREEEKEKDAKEEGVRDAGR